jgi:hypothetical protein
MKEMENLVDLITKKNFLTKATKNLPLSRQRLGYKIYLSGYKEQSYSWHSRKYTRDKHIIVYQDSDMDMIGGLNKIIVDNKFKNIGIYPALGVYYLGPLIEEFHLHAFFLRANKERGEASGYLQEGLKNYVEIIRLGSETDPHEIVERQHDHYLNTPVPFSASSSLLKELVPLNSENLYRYSMYEMPELPLAQQFYDIFRENLAEMGPIGMFNFIIDDPTLFNENKFYNFL